MTDPILVRVSPEILARMKTGDVEPVVILGVEQYEDGTYDMTLKIPDLHASRALWIRAFNRLEKAVTNHIEQRCIDADDLAHAHKAVMRDLGPNGEGS